MVQRTAPAAAGSVRWRDIFATLIAAGHNPERIGHYTERQLKLHYDAACRRERHQRADHIVDTNAGTWGGDDVGKLLRELRK
ncbi:hypothetical protein PVT67_15640 [Gallaecimonas kandeliae]|uniref:hypothetical protein n=1 Tax=Gallaecimonas kandeliae TaxID=3029055 RepID=UPI0026474FDA|nr:hypothetical protein [Gallaecimonas kandeliae]WKE65075.1 hypothetical protein PVT67_15640 [Gallaecimonas kandeliae]